MSKTIGGLTESTAVLVGDEPVEIEVGGASRKAKARRFGQRHPGRVAGRWYGFSPAVAVGSAFATGFIRFVPVWVDEKLTFTDMAVRVTTLAAGGAFSLALYASDPVTKLPTGEPVAKTALTMSTNAGGNIQASNVGGAATINPGLYYMACMVDATASNVAIFQSVSVAMGDAGWLIGSATLANILAAAGTHYCSYTLANTFSNGWPDVTGASFGENTSAANPAIYFLVSAVF